MEPVEHKERSAKRSSGSSAAYCLPTYRTAEHRRELCKKVLPMKMSHHPSHALDATSKHRAEPNTPEPEE